MVVLYSKKTNKTKNEVTREIMIFIFLVNRLILCKIAKTKTKERREREKPNKSIAFNIIFSSSL